MIYFTIASFFLALALGFVSTIVLKRLSLKVGLVDHPDQNRKLHKKPIPLVGGIAVFFSSIIAIALLWLFGGEGVAVVVPGQQWKLFGLALACFLILTLGVIDDRFAIRGRQKLLGQIAIATVLVLFGYRFDTLMIFDYQFDLEIFAIIAVYGWILLGINSVNLLDGADGFATTIGMLMSIALTVMAYHLGMYQDAMICAAVSGALAAFMIFNFPPATAYLGDAGSMLIGLFISAMAIKCTFKEAAAYAFLAPIALLAIPMFDTIAAIVRRRLTGRSIYAVDRGHLHHALIRKGFGPRKALLLFFAMCLMTATGATLSLVYRQSEYAVLSIFAVVIFLIVGKVFGLAEYKLITSRSKSIFRSFFSRPTYAKDSHHHSVRLQGERNWDQCWQVLREFAEERQLHSMTMDLNLPWIHESFHAKYSVSNRKSAPEQNWAVELPLLINGRVIGRVDLLADVEKADFATVTAELSSILGYLEDYFITTIGSSIALPVKDEDLAERQSVEFSTGKNAGQSASGDSQKVLDVG